MSAIPDAEPAAFRQKHIRDFEVLQEDAQTAHHHGSGCSFVRQMQLLWRRSRACRVEIQNREECLLRQFPLSRWDALSLLRRSDRPCQLGR